MKFGVLVLLWLPLLAAAAAAPLDFRPGPVVEWPMSAGGNGHFFQAIETPNGVTWDDAQSYAGLRGGYLATITSAAENQFVFKLIDDSKYWILNAPYNEHNLGPWLGGHRLPVPGPVIPDQNWVWANNGRPMTYTNWAPTEPDNSSSGTEDRLQFMSYIPTERQPTWNDVGNDYKLRGLVIEFDAAPPPGLAGPSAYLRPDVIRELPQTAGGNGHWYQATPHGGYLATIESADENAFVFKLINDPKYWTTNNNLSSTYAPSTISTGLLTVSSGTTSLVFSSGPSGSLSFSPASSGYNFGPWLGGFRLPNAARPDVGWVWDHNHAPFTYTNWAPNEPFDSGGEIDDRLEFMSRTPASRLPIWNNIDNKFLLHGFVVEYDRDPAVTPTALAPGSPPLLVPLLIATTASVVLFLAGLWVFLFRRPREEEAEPPAPTPPGQTGGLR
jgi:hypothetical protein